MSCHVTHDLLKTEELMRANITWFDRCNSSVKKKKQKHRCRLPMKSKTKFSTARVYIRGRREPMVTDASKQTKKLSAAVAKPLPPALCRAFSVLTRPSLNWVHRSTMNVAQETSFKTSTCCILFSSPGAVTECCVVACRMIECAYRCAG